MQKFLDVLTSVGERRPRLVLGVFLVLALASAGVSLTLVPSSSINTLVSSSSRDYQATQLDDRQFGGDAVVVLVRGPLTGLLASKNLGVLSNLEACLGGQEVKANSSLAAYTPVAAAKAKPYGGSASPCGHLMANTPAQVVYGPATFLNQAVVAVNRELTSVLASASAAVKAKEAQALKLAKARGLNATQQQELVKAAGQVQSTAEEQKLLKLASGTGLSLSDIPSIDNANFISTVVFNSGSGASTPKTRFSYLFPSADSALIQVRLRPSLSNQQEAQAINWIRAATRMPQFALGSGDSYLVSGEPVVLDDVANSLSGQVVLLLVGAVVVMAIVLLLVFRRRLRLLPLVLALGAAAITFGLCAAGGGTLTMASIAVLPILIGLAVDYGIQFQSRASGASTIAAAALATATGFLVLLLSPVPMVRGFGLLLVIGVAVAFIIVLCAGSAALALRGPLPGMSGALGASIRGAGELLAAPLVSAGELLAAPLVRVGGLLAALLVSAGAGLTAAGRGAWEIIVPRRVARSRQTRVTARGGPGMLDLLTRRPRAIIALGLLLAAAGWVADTHTAVQSDVTKLVPKNLPALTGLNVLEKTTGESGELDVLVHGTNVATPATVAWMVSYEQQIVSHFGYVESKGCRVAVVCPALSLPDLFSSSTSSASGSSVSNAAALKLTQAQINTLLAAVPSYFSQAVITKSRRYASLSFGIRLMPLSQQIRVVNFMRSHLHPPAGITAKLAGLPVLVADADGALSSSTRRLLTLVAGLLAVGLMLMVIFRRPRRALTPLIPIVLATGWSALIVWAIGIPLNPMSATLGALVIAISTEFSVLLSERFRRQRAEGEDPAQALASAYRSTGKAVTASGITAIAGFAVLIVSNVTMLRDFGLVTLIDMTVSLLGVLAVLPAVLTLTDRGERPESPVLRRPRRKVAA